MRNIAFITGPALGHFGRAFQVATKLASIADCRISFIRPDVDRFDSGLFPDRFDIRRLSVKRPAECLPCIPFGDALDALFESEDFDAIVQDCNPLNWLATTRFPSSPRINITNVFLTRAAQLPTQQARNFEREKPAVNAERARKGMAPVGDCHQLYEADAVLYADPGPVVGLFPELPDNHRGCGACWWSYEGEIPGELKGLNNYLLCSLGSTGRLCDDRTFEVLADLFDCDDIVCVYAGPRGDRPENIGERRIHYFDRLPLASVVRQAGAVISQGGAGSTYQALGVGKPLAIMPTHINHRILGELVERLGAGICANASGEVEPLGDGAGTAIRAGARWCAEIMKHEDGALEIAKRIAQIADV